MRVLLDSTYLLPLIGVRVRSLDSRILLELKHRHRLLVSDISLFELAAKGAKYVVQGVLDPEDVTQGIQSLRMDPEITVVPFIGTQVQNTSYVLRRTLNDYIDCLILSTAMNEADVLLMEDRTIQGFMEDESIRGLAHAIAPDFRVLNYDQLRAVTS